MATTYSWKAKALDYIVDSEGLTNVVTSARFWLTGVSDAGTRASKEVIFTLESPDSENFIAYENLTETTVKSWTVDNLSELDMGAHTSSIEQHIDTIENPTELSGLPWDYVPIDEDF
jgi:hypothetical protein